MSQQSQREDFTDADSPHFSTDRDATNLPAWTEIEAGRFMPRRVRGSCRGRALG